MKRPSKSRCRPARYTLHCTLDCDAIRTGLYSKLHAAARTAFHSNRGTTADMLAARLKRPTAAWRDAAQPVRNSRVPETPPSPPPTPPSPAPLPSPAVRSHLKAAAHRVTSSHSLAAFSSTQARPRCKQTAPTTSTPKNLVEGRSPSDLLPQRLRTSVNSLRALLQVEHLSRRPQRPRP